MSPALLLLLALACRTPEDTAPPVDTGPVDADADGWAAWEDCDDDDPAVFPGAPELCNGADDDCDGVDDDGVLLDLYEDADGDGWGDPGAAVQACEAPSGHVAADAAGDCDDDDPAVHPEADEACNGADDDCDGDVDEGVLLDFLLDADGDGWGDPDSTVQACEAPADHVGAEATGDCDDGDPAIHPEADEACNGTDDDCDGDTDEGVLLDWWADIDGDGWGNADYHSQACEAGVGMVDNDQDCDDANLAVHPEADELCNGVDDDCDGDTDERCAP